MNMKDSMGRKAQMAKCVCSAVTGGGGGAASDRQVCSGDGCVHGRAGRYGARCRGGRAFPGRARRAHGSCRAGAHLSAACLVSHSPGAPQQPCVLHKAALLHVASWHSPNFCPPSHAQGVSGCSVSARLFAFLCVELSAALHHYCVSARLGSGATLCIHLHELEGIHH